MFFVPLFAAQYVHTVRESGVAMQTRECVRCGVWFYTEGGGGGLWGPKQVYRDGWGGWATINVMTQSNE